MKLDNSIYEKEMEKIKEFWQRVEKNKPPRKITPKYCSGCPYFSHCRGK